MTPAARRPAGPRSPRASTDRPAIAAPRLLFPERATNPLRALLRRVGLAIGVLLLVAGLTWLGRDGYRDVDDSTITVLDAIYYASVTVTTTGYGDITPVSPGARAVTAFVVTPARILFLIILVGTTIELLTERFRDAVAQSRWRKRMDGHVIIVGFGTKGRGAFDTLMANGTATVDEIVAIDSSADAIAEARAAGVVAIYGDATRTNVLRQAKAHTASAVIVTCHRDDTATLVTLTARELNPTAMIAAAVRETENAHLLRQSGATTVIVSSEASGRMLGMATSSVASVELLEDLLVAGRGLELVERAPQPAEVGGPPRADGDTLPLALIRGGVPVPFNDPRFGHVEADDTIVCIVARS